MKTSEIMDSYVENVKEKGNYTNQSQITILDSVIMNTQLNSAQKGELVKSFMEYNFDVNIRSDYGTNPSSLFNAAFRGQLEVVQALLLDAWVEMSPLKYYIFADYVNQDIQSTISTKLKNAYYSDYFFKRGFLPEEGDSYLSWLPPEITYRIAEYCEEDTTSLLGDEINTSD